MKKRLIIFIISLIYVSYSKCQENEAYSIAKEKLIDKKSAPNGIPLKTQYNFVGTTNGNVSVALRDGSENLTLFVFEDYNGSLKVDALSPNQDRNKIIRLKRHEDLTAIIGYHNLAQQFLQTPLSKIPYDHQDIWIQYQGRELKVDSLPFHYFDKYYEIKFSNDGQYLICNPFTSVSAGYTAEDDGFIFLYDLKGIENGRVKKTIINCSQCLNAFVFGNTMVFQKEIPERNGFDGDFHNIYQSSVNNVEDTTLLAFNIELWAISPDKKFILGTKYLYGRNTPVIVDLANGKYQFILGRNYPMDHCFYSKREKKFAFDLGDSIAYIEFPKSYPFSSKIRHANAFTTKEQDDAFWKKFSYK